MPRNRKCVGLITRMLLLLTAMACTIVASSATAAAASSRADTATGVPAQGIFENCDLDTELSQCIQRLQVMQQGGLQVVVLGLQDSDSLANIQAYDDAAAGLGMSVMWEINDPGFWGGAPIGASVASDFSDFSSACGCSDPSQLLTYMIQWLSALPATYGYYAADDESISPGQTAGLTAYVNEIKAAAPGEMVMIGAFAGSSDSTAGTGATIGDELYPETSTSLMPMDQNLAMWQWVQQSITQDQQTEDKQDVPSAFILQAFTFGDNLDDGEAVGVCTPSMSQRGCYDKLLYPSESVQLALRNQVLEHADPKLILWYSFAQTYGQAGDDTFSIYPTGATATARWAGLSDAIQAPYPETAIAHEAKAKHKRHHRKHKKHRKAKHRSKRHRAASKRSRSTRR